jgi:hypothetical protein
MKKPDYTLKVKVTPDDVQVEITAHRYGYGYNVLLCRPSLRQAMIDARKWIAER